jgi:hypothetical protein
MFIEQFNIEVPTARDIIHTSLAAIQSHPLIQNPPVYYPLTIRNKKQEQIKIKTYRQYDGLELIQPGLTLSMFPSYTEGSYSVGLKPDAIGSKQGQASYKFRFALHYRDVALGQQTKVRYYKALNYLPTFISHGEQVALDVYKEDVQEISQRPVGKDQFILEVNPGEDILRDYLALLKIILDDIPRVLPWVFRTYVLGYTFPTSSWIKKDEDLIFHYAYLDWELVGLSPGSLRELGTSPPSELNF